MKQKNADFGVRNAESLSNPQSAFRSPQSPIKVLLVDDSMLTLTILKRMLAHASEIQVVGTATNGKEALDMIPVLRPDVICTDLRMPVMDGLDLTKAVMQKFPRPILVLSVSVQKEQTANIFQVLEAGAIDVMAKPLGNVGMNWGLDAETLVSKIKILAGVVPIRRRSTEPEPAANIPPPATLPRIVGIGASTGGPQAFREILAHLPACIPVPLICVQHISDEFMAGMVEWLAPQCSLKIASAKTGIDPQPGTAYFPAPGLHLIVNGEGKLECSNAPSYGGHRPSISLTFNSLARHYGNSTVGVLLSGMGRDGVEGMRSIAQAGGTTIAQDEETSLVFGMPKEAIAANAARHVLPLAEIAPALLKLFGLERRKPRSQ